MKAAVNNEKKTNETKEKLVDYKLIDFQDDFKNFVKFCKEKSYECFFDKAKIFNEFMSLSKVLYLFLIKVYCKFTLIFAKRYFFFEFFFLNLLFSIIKLRLNDNLSYDR